MTGGVRIVAQAGNPDRQYPGRRELVGHHALQANRVARIDAQLCGSPLACTQVLPAKASPGRVRWATSGVGTTGHRVLERVRAASGVDITHIPYKGGGPQLADALAGEFEVLSSNVGELQFQYVREGRLKALAVGAPARLDVLPGVPTLAEAGFPEANLASTFGLFAPGRTPPHVVARLNRAFDAALRDPEIQRRLLTTGNVPTGGTAADFAAQIAREREASGNLARGSARQAR